MKTMKSWRSALALSILALTAAGTASAADVEITAFGGYNLGGSIDVREDQSFEINTVDSFSTGIGLAWKKTETYTFELAWNWRPTEVEGELPGSNEPMKLNTLNAHDFTANFLFSPAYQRGKAIPYLLVGLGATYLVPGEIAGQELDSTTRFSWALGAGAKTYMNDRLGLRAQVRFHSTYVSDESGGIWCNPYYCYEAVDTNWLDEWDFTAGIVIRAGS